MKLLLCLNCMDVFKLDYKSRACKCGMVKGGYYDDGHTSWTNGKGVSIGLALPDITSSYVRLVNDTKKLEDPTNHVDKYSIIEDYSIRCWMRPNDGFWNDNSEIIED